METRFFGALFGLLFLLGFVSFVFAAEIMPGEDTFGQINPGEGMDEGVGEEIDVDLGESLDEGAVDSSFVGDNSNEILSSETIHTSSFYWALGFGVVGLLVVVWLILSFIFRPKNRWKK